MKKTKAWILWTLFKSMFVLSFMYIRRRICNRFINEEKIC